MSFAEGIVFAASAVYLASQAKRKSSNKTMPYRKPQQRKRTTAGKGTTKFLKEYTMQYKRPSAKAAYSGPYDRTHKEKKFFDSVTNIAPVQTFGSIIPSLNVIPQGTAEQQRIGRKINITDIFQKIVLTMPVGFTAGNSSDEIRIILYCDSQTNGSVIAVTDILASAVFTSFYKMSDIQRFKILSDKTHTINCAMDGEAVSESVETAKSFKKAFTNLNKTIEYNDVLSTGVISTIRSNNIGMLMITRRGFMVFNVTTRIRFTD